MNRLVEIKPRFVETIPYPDELEYGVLYISERYGVAQHLCPCGCGDRCVIDLQPEWRTGWKMTMDEEGRVTLRPSILNPSCKIRSHYYITENKIDWL